MSTFTTDASRAGRWVRRGRTIVLPDPWLPRGHHSALEAAWRHETGTSSASDVAWFQDSLNRVMGSGLAVDGVLGPYTRAAIAAFQQREGLVADGIPGPPTKAALEAALASAPPAASPPAASPGLPPGIGTFDGKPCASWLIPYLEWARANGWQGRLNSAWRSPEYSEKLCFDKCGAPSCPGTCAGRKSKHSAYIKPDGAIDVSDEKRFGELMARSPFSPRICNKLPKDLIHFSATGY